MKNDILLSKIVANSTDTSWSQAYSTLNLFIVASIEKSEDNEKNIVLIGKSILEKLQREFFAIDEKNLENIKNAVKNTVEHLDQDIDLSLALATISKNICYIITLGQASVGIIREDKYGTVAKGVEKQIDAFSGFLINKDILVIQTKGFSNKVSLSKLSELFKTSQILEVSENVAPLIHDGADGTEAGIILECNLEGIQKQEKQEEEEDLLEEEQIEREPLKKTTHFGITRPTIGIAKTLSKDKIEKIPQLLKNYFMSKNKTGIFAIIIILIIILVSSILLEQKKQNDQREEEIFKAFIVPNQKKYDEALKISDSNKALALENLSSAKENLNLEKEKFEKNKGNQEIIEKLLNSIDQKIKELDSPTKFSDKKVIFENKSQSLKEIGKISFQEGNITISDKTNGNILIVSATDGKTSQSIETKLSVKDQMVRGENSIFILTDEGIYKIDVKTKKSQKIIQSDEYDSITSIGTYLGHVYLLDGKSINKYLSPSYDKTSYLEKGVELEGTPVSLTIDGSIWVINDGGKIKKFTKGKEETFEIKGLKKTIGADSIIFTNVDYDNIYVLDKTNKIIFIISKSGEYKDYYDLNEFSKINSFSVDEENKSIFIATDKDIYSTKF